MPLPAEPLIADKGHRHSLRSRVASQLGVANKDLIAYLTEEGWKSSEDAPEIFVGMRKIKKKRLSLG